jgi:hypothetical protein
MPRRATDPNVLAWREAMREASALDEGLASAADLDRELVLDARTGAPRQAGGEPSRRGQLSEEMMRWRRGFERSLFAFSRGILGNQYLTAGFHRDGCDFIQKVPPYRKLFMWPREFGKSTFTAQTLPMHMLIQPKGANVYFPTQSDLGGDDVRIVLACETLERGQDHLRVVRSKFEGNKRLRAFWPHRVWENARRQSRKWNDNEIIIPREREWADPSIRVIGVGGAITGAHPIALIKDDLISLAAANSVAVMQDAKRWHMVSRALINKPWALEITNGTHWAVGDLYDDIKRDPTVECVVRSIVEGGESLWPEEFPAERIAQLQAEFGSMFPLLYMNSTSDPELVDFDVGAVRSAVVERDRIVIEEDSRDEELRRALDPDAAIPRTPLAGKPLSALWTEGTPRDRYVRFKYG